MRTLIRSRYATDGNQTMAVGMEGIASSSMHILVQLKIDASPVVQKVTKYMNAVSQKDRILLNQSRVLQCQNKRAI